MYLERSDEVDLATQRRFFQFINDELIPRYGSMQVIAELADLNPSTAQNYKKGTRFPKVGSLDRIASVWRAGAKAQDLLEYLREGQDRVPPQETLEAIYMLRLKDRSAVDKLRLAEKLLKDAYEEINPRDRLISNE